MSQMLNGVPWQKQSVSPNPRDQGCQIRKRRLRKLASHDLLAPVKRLFFIALVSVCSFSTLNAAEPIEFTVGEFAFNRPTGWAWIAAASPMRKAQLLVKGDDNATADVVFFHFGPGQGGTVEANVQRWVAQFEDGKSTSKKETINGKEITFVEATGTFLSGMPGTPSVPLEGFAMRAAILESPEGDVYVKMTGPLALVDSAASDFMKMISEARRKAL